MSALITPKQQELTRSYQISQLSSQTLVSKLFVASTHPLPSNIKRIAILLFLLLTAVAIPASLQAQTFRSTPALSFTKAFEGNDPLPQLVTIASTSTNFSFSAKATSTTGGDWLTMTQGDGCCYATPQGVTVSANPAVTLAAGTYTGQIVATNSAGTVSLTIPVSLTIEATNTAFFDDVAGGLTFSMITKGTAPPAQSVQIRNGGAGSLAWTAATSTSDGGAWLTLSAASGTAPSYLSVTINPAKLPGVGLTQGTFTGQVVLKTTGDSVTIPITAIVGDSVFRQINPLNFTKIYAGGDPLSQVITIANTGTNNAFYATAINSTGGDWLSITQGDGCCYNTPTSITVSANPDVTLAAGTYSSEIIIKQNNGLDAMIIPVTLTIAPPNTAFFDSISGDISFSMATDGVAPPMQAITIRDGGSGTLAWTATASTSDGGNWLTLSAASGTAPSYLSAGVDVANFPGGGLTAGTFTGQIILQSGNDRVTVPITVNVGTSVFRQVNPLSFNKTFAGANPLSQVVTIASTGASFAFYAAAVSSTGGDWLSITNGDGCCYNTPTSITVSVNPAVTLAAGTYYAEIVAKSNNANDSLIIPVSLTVATPSATYFDALPGELTFSMLTQGVVPPAQSLQIRNAGAGTLAWTAAGSTSDGGNWLTLSAASGTAPSFLSVGINPANLPGGGLTAGTFNGQVILQTGQDRVTIPVAVTVGAQVFQQINPLYFTKPYAGNDPLPQVITIASTGANIAYSALAVNSTGGNWLSITHGDGCCYNSSDPITVNVNPAVTLVAGTYSAEIVVKSSNSSLAMTVPVTLNIEPATATFFDALPGEATFVTTTAGPAIPSQTIQVRNGGIGTLDWTSVASTSDGGKWLTATPASSTSPSLLTLAVNRANLPGKGLVAGVFNGQVLLQTGTDRVSIPVAVTVGTSVFKPLPPISFTKAFQGTNPAAQTITIGTTSANFAYSAEADTANGGAWLTVTHSDGCCYNTPDTITVTAAPAQTLAAGVYSGQIIYKSYTGGQSMIVPITLTIDAGGSGATNTPTFTPNGGSDNTAQTVSILDSTHDSAIYYTIDGSTPTTASRLYTGPFTVAANLTETIKAIAIAPAFKQSAVATAVFKPTGTQAAEPAASELVTITEATTGATVYYTLNGTTPTTASTKYTVPIAVSTSEVLKFIAVAPGDVNSVVRTVSITVN